MSCKEQTIEGLVYSCAEPQKAEVAELYAMIIEPAGKRDIEEFLTSDTKSAAADKKTDSEKVIFVICRDPRGKLIGVLKGWDWGNGKGIIENVAVHGKHQYKNIARTLVERHKKTSKSIGSDILIGLQRSWTKI
jgi:ribosomal protein S18 acetylase RimI-like enzyme